MSYLLKLLDSTDSTASLKHFAYALVVACSCCWLSYDLAIKTGNEKRGIDGNWCVAFASLLAAVTTGKVMGGKVEGGNQ